MLLKMPTLSDNTSKQIRSEEMAEDLSSDPIRRSRTKSVTASLATAVYNAVSNRLDKKVRLSGDYDQGCLRAYSGSGP